MQKNMLGLSTTQSVLIKAIFAFLIAIFIPDIGYADKRAPVAKITQAELASGKESGTLTLRSSGKARLVNVRVGIPGRPFKRSLRASTRKRVGPKNYRWRVTSTALSALTDGQSIRIRTVVKSGKRSRTQMLTVKIKGEQPSPSDQPTGIADGLQVVQPTNPPTTEVPGESTPESCLKALPGVTMRVGAWVKTVFDSTEVIGSGYIAVEITGEIQNVQLTTLNDLPVEDAVSSVVEIPDSKTTQYLTEIKDPAAFSMSSESAVKITFIVTSATGLYSCSADVVPDSISS